MSRPIPMPEQIPDLNPQLTRSLKTLLAEIVFTPDNAASVQDRHWHVTVMPQSESSGKFDALVTILPRSENDAVAEGQVIEAQRTDASPLSAQTNHLGQAWFLGMERGTYGLRLCEARGAATKWSSLDNLRRDQIQVVVQKIGSGSYRLSLKGKADRAWADEKEKLLSSANEINEELALAADSGMKSEYTDCDTGDDRRVTAIVETGSGLPVLHLAAKVPGITNATLHFRIDITDATPHFRIAFEEIAIRLDNGSASLVLDADLPDNFRIRLKDLRIES